MSLNNHTSSLLVLCVIFILSILTPSRASGLLTIQPEDNFISTGAVGGPFAPLEKQYTLTNSGNAGLYWGGEIQAAWLDIQPEWGQLDPNESVVVTVSILPAAQSLSGGVYNDEVVFTDITNNDQISRQVQLTVAAAEGVLEVTPLVNWIATGEPGGPFTPAYQDYTLKNSGGSNLYWGVNLSTAWLTADDTFGDLEPNQTTVVRVSLNSQADSLGEGNHTSTIEFNNLSTSQSAITRTSILQIENIGGIWVSPEQLITELTEGTTKLLALTVGNDSNSIYSFSIRTRVVAGSSTSLSSPVMQDEIPAGVNFSVPLSTDFHPGRILVRFKQQIQAAPDASAKKTQIADTLGGTVRNDISLVPGLSVVQLPQGMTVQEALVTYNASSDVLYAQPDYYVYADATLPNDSRFSEQWALHNTGQTGGTSDADMDAPEAWDINTGDNSVIVAVIDTGVDYTHPDLAANMWVNQAEKTGTTGVDDDGNGYIDDIYGYDFCNDDPDPKDDHYHGTHCAGIIGAVGNNGVGVSGACWNVKIMAVKFLDSGGDGWTSDAIECVQYATKMNARVMSNSWGGGAYDQALKDAIDAAKAKGILFVAAAGNDGSNNDSYPHYPSNYTSENVISVMATTSTDAKASFSNYGLTTVDIGAPGDTILSTAPSNTYRTLSGTSMAAPYVSGACCLLWAADPYLNWQEVKNLLMQTVDPTLANKCVAGGRLNLQKAIQEIRVPWLNLDVEQGTLNPGQSISVGVTVDASQLTPGVYRAQILVLSNDPLHPTITIPVEVTVTKDPLEIQPNSAFESQGVEGGPFTPASMAYTLKNTGLQPVVWSVNSPASWLDIQPSTGSLDPAQSVQVLVSLKQDVLSFVPDIYTGSLSFQNVTCGSIQTKQASLTVRCPDKLTESFIAQDNDLSYSSLTFIPENSRAYYRLCLDPNSMTSLPFDPAQAAYIPLGDDDYAEIFFADGKEFFFFGQYYSSVFVGSNGYVTFGDGDLEYENTLQNHFSMPRIAGLFTDLTPPDTHRIAYQQSAESFTVTYSNVPAYGDKTKTISFQIELFFNDGQIQLRYLDNQQFNGITGLSDGTGFVASSQESNLGSYKKCCECGDITGDSAITLEDLQVFASAWLTSGCGIPGWCEFADLNKDTTVDLTDMNWLSQRWEGQAPYAWSVPQFCLDLNNKSSYGASAACVSSDYQTIYYERYLPEEGKTRILQSTITDFPTGFDSEIVLNGLSSSGFSVGDPWISQDGRRLYYMKGNPDTKGTIAMAQPSSDPNSSIVAYWKFSEGTGSVTQDSSPNGRIGQIYGGAAWTTGYIDTCLNFDGVDDYVTIPYTSALNPVDFTVAFWAKVHGKPVAFCAPVCSRDYNSATGIVTGYNVYVSDDNKWEFWTGTGTTIWNVIEGLNVDFGTWTHVAVSFKATSGPVNGIYTGTKKIYINGSEITAVTITNGQYSPNTNQPLTLGRINHSEKWYFDGLIDEVRIYDRELSEAEVKALAEYPYILTSFPELNGNGLSAGPALTADELSIVYETNCTTEDYTAYWKFSEGTGSAIQDSSANGRSGQIYGSAAWTTGYMDSCLKFDGINDYVVISGYKGITGQQPRTVSAWICGSNNGQIIAWGALQTGQKWLIRLNEPTSAYPGALRAEIQNGRVVGTQNLWDGAWHHIAVTWEPDTTPDIADAKLYVDGIPETLTEVTPCMLNTVGTNDVSIGAFLADKYYFNGMTDELRIYGRALNATEINALWKNPSDSILWTASRESVNDPFTNIRPLNELNSQFKQTQPTLSADGLTIYFSSNRENGQSWNIYKATRPSLDTPFTIEGILPAANNLSKDGSPFVSEDGQLIYYYKETSTQKGLWVSQWQQSDEPCEPK